MTTVVPYQQGCIGQMMKMGPFMGTSCAAQCASNWLMGLEQTFTDVRIKDDSGDRDELGKDFQGCFLPNIPIESILVAK